MKKFLMLITLISVLASCTSSDNYILPTSVGKINKVMVVTKSSIWESEVGDEIRTHAGKYMVGLPQPETTLSLSQVAPNGFNRMMKISRNILIVEEADTAKFTVSYNKFATPQTIVYLSAKNRGDLVKVINTNHQKIIDIFRASDIKFLQDVFARKRIDDSQYKTLQNLNISLTIPEEFRTVDDTGEFLWLRQHLQSGIARGTGTNNILVYALPLKDTVHAAENISVLRDSIGQKYIPGTREGMYMITEEAYTPHTFPVVLNDNKAFETRGKWEVKNDFMAGPFLNYAIVDKKNNRLLVFEGFTYAPSVNKREFIFELEAIAKSMVIR